jgi:hypothetical protein
VHTYEEAGWVLRSNIKWSAVCPEYDLCRYYCYTYFGVSTYIVGILAVTLPPIDYAMVLLKETGYYGEQGSNCASASHYSTGCR